MASPRKFHLFNCDRVYKLDSIEHLLLTTTRNLGIEISVKQHYFTVSEITEFSDQTIPTLEIDAAILVVNANESRINICFWATELDIDLSYSITIPAR